MKPLTAYQQKCADNKANRELRDMGCPYETGDPETMIWLKGYKAGLDAGFEAASKAIAA